MNHPATAFVKPATPPTNSRGTSNPSITATATPAAAAQTAGFGDLAGVHASAIR